MPRYDAFQSVFYLSVLSNIASHYVTKKADILGAQFLLAIAPKVAVPRVPVSSHMPASVVKDVSELIGTWRLAWGPSVHVTGSSASNSMFVAYCENLTFDDGVYPAYVVAIAGTDMYSAFDWIMEDGNIDHWYNFNDLISGQKKTHKPSFGSSEGPLTEPYISAGTYLGLQTLLSMKSVPQGVMPDRDLQTFLTGINDDKARIIFTGHSLGGALSPALALYFQEVGVLREFKDCYVYPSAGPTPGNTHFAKLFNTRFPPKPDQAQSHKAWNTNITNQRDVVPHAWALETLPEIYTIYDNTEADLPESVKLPIKGANLASRFALAAGMIYGRINHWIGERPYDGYPPNSIEQFLMTLGAEHVDAYYSGNVLGTEPGLILPDKPASYWNLIPLLEGVKFR